MAFCRKCGQEIPDGMRYCTACGTDSQSGETYGGGQNSWPFEMRDETWAFHPEDIRRNKGYAVLAYLGILVLVPILGAKHSAFARFHAGQGLLLLIIGVAKSLFFRILQAVLDTTIFGILEPAFAAVSGILSLLLLAGMVFGIVCVVQGKAKELPIIGRWRLLK
ncbi:zinc ribbon domain-containing protein [Ructibacterium gallinarum]|uniref:Zinc ribbon domain-containing protein n=1 Tax=Ructibacterium gallinarum TaxID=2779355 RepID=A0A9D5RBC8_9FIRM|nr:zinc ribbon domain-containing protein [Ructibacterium gallinarum]MBE5039898.1 zinc ribbon domain-containing protein [Ructibacterium gallinarum]